MDYGSELGSEYLSEYAYEIEQSFRDCICGMCKWNRYDGKGFFCGNGHSENYTNYTAYTDGCDEWQGK